MKDKKIRLWRCTKVYKALVIAFSAGCLGGLALTVLITFFIV